MPRDIVPNPAHGPARPPRPRHQQDQAQEQGPNQGEQNERFNDPARRRRATDRPAPGAGGGRAARA